MGARSQGTYRTNVIGLYGKKCLVCDNSIVEACHIVDSCLFTEHEYSKYNEYNGIPLCPTHHTSYDKNIISFNSINNTENTQEYIDVEIYEKNKLLKTIKLHINTSVYLRWRTLKYRYPNLGKEYLHELKKICTMDNGFCYDYEDAAIMLF